MKTVFQKVFNLVRRKEANLIEIIRFLYLDLLK